MYQQNYNLACSSDVARNVCGQWMDVARNVCGQWMDVALTACGSLVDVCSLVSDLHQLV